MNQLDSQKISVETCKFALLCQFPNGEVHQVVIKEEHLKELLKDLQEFKVHETILEGVEFNNQ